MPKPLTVNTKEKHCTLDVFCILRASNNFSVKQDISALYRILGAHRGLKKT